MSEVACEDPWRSLYDGIARVLLDNRLEPTPTNYALAHRYLTAQDRAFDGSVEGAVLRGQIAVRQGIVGRRRLETIVEQNTRNAVIKTAPRIFAGHLAHGGVLDRQELMNID